MSKPTDFEAMFPPAVEIQEAFQHSAPAFAFCPRHHPLPHRCFDGRCTPASCHDDEPCGARQAKAIPAKDTKGYRQYLNENGIVKTMAAELDMVPIGLENTVVDRDIHGAADAERVKAQNLEAMELMRALGRRAAREALHPHPEIPKPPDIAALGAKGYVRKRLEDMAPYLVEAEIFEMLHGTAEKSAAARSRLLNRGGITEKPAEEEDRRGPVVILNQIVSPYERQRELNQIPAPAPRIVSGDPD